MSQAGDDKAKIWGVFDMDECPHCGEAHALYLSDAVAIHAPGATYKFVCPETGLEVGFNADEPYYPLKSGPDDAITLHRIDVESSPH